MGQRGVARPNMDGGRSASTVVCQELNAADRRLLVETFMESVKFAVENGNPKPEVIDLAERIRAGWNGR